MVVCRPAPFIGDRVNRQVYEILFVSQVNAHAACDDTPPGFACTLYRDAQANLQVIIVQQEQVCPDPPLRGSRYSATLRSGAGSYVYR